MIPLKKIEHYVMFSVLLDPPEEVSEEQAHAARKVVLNMNDLNEGDGGTTAETAGDILGKPSVLISSNRGGDVEFAVSLIQAWINFLGLEYGVFMSWAEIYRSPGVNKCSGGGVVVTRADAIYVNSNDCLRDAAEAGVEVMNM